MARPLSCFLITFHTPDGALRKVINENSFNIGRAHECAVSFSDLNVSRNHLLVKIKSGKVWIEDLGSANGTFINGGKIDPKRLYPVEPTDRIKLGTSGPEINLDSIERIFNEKAVDESSLKKEDKEAVMSLITGAHAEAARIVAAGKETHEKMVKLAEDKVMQAEKQMQLNYETVMHDARQAAKSLVDSAKAHYDRTLTECTDECMKIAKDEAATFLADAQRTANQVLQDAQGTAQQLLEESRITAYRTIEESRLAATTGADEIRAEAEKYAKEHKEASERDADSYFAKRHQEIEQYSIKKTAEVDDYRAEQEKSSREMMAKEIEAYIKEKRELESAIQKERNEFESTMGKEKHDFHSAMHKEKNEFETEMRKKRDDFEAEMREKKDAFESAIMQKKEDFDSAIKKETEDFEAAFHKRKSELDAIIRDSTEQLQKLTPELKSARSEFEILTAGAAELRLETEKLKLEKADLVAMEAKRGELASQTAKLEKQLAEAEKELPARLAENHATFEKESSKRRAALEEELTALRLAEMERLRRERASVMESISRERERIGQKIWVDVQNAAISGVPTDAWRSVASAVETAIQNNLKLQSVSASSEESLSPLITEMSATRRRSRVLFTLQGFFAGLLVVGIGWRASQQFFSDVDPVKAAAEEESRRIKEDLERRRFNPAKDDQLRDTYMDCVIYTQGFSENYRSPEFQKEWMKKASAYFLKKWKVQEESVIQVLAATNTLVGTLAERKEAIHPDHVQEGLKKMTELEEETLGRVKELLGSEVRLEAFKRLEKKTYQDFYSGRAPAQNEEPAQE